MASNAEPARAEYNFVEQPSEEFFCPVTYELLQDPVQTNFCCGNHLSRAVAERLQADGKPCPMCKETPLKTTDDRFFKRKVRALRVRCSNTPSGCEWVGEIGDLGGHLNVGKVEGSCGYVVIKCPLECGIKIPRRYLKMHQSNECDKRPFSCEYCDFKSTYENVVDHHWPKCQRYPLICPNKCSTDEIERRFVQNHIKNKCPLEKVSCKYSFAGCKAKVERKSMQKHLDDSKDDHLDMTVTECMCHRAELTELKLALAESVPKLIFHQPPDFILDNFEERKREDDTWYSPPFYTHIGGYRMCLSINANGWGGGKGTHVGVTVYMMKGEFDSHLKWPFKGIITVELVNQKEGGKNLLQKPVSHTHSDERDKNFQRVTEGDRAKSGWGLPRFISHSNLYKPEEGKEYLLNDTLIFRLTNVEVTSI